MEPSNKPKKSAMEKLIAQGIQCDYVKFQGPVPRGPNLEPVYEFRLEAKDSKYKVDQISKDGDTVYWRIGQVIEMTPWVNVAYARPILSGSS